MTDVERICLSFPHKLVVKPFHSPQRQGPSHFPTVVSIGSQWLVLLQAMANAMLIEVRPTRLQCVLLYGSDSHRRFRCEAADTSAEQLSPSTAPQHCEWTMKESTAHPFTHHADSSPQLQRTTHTTHHSPLTTLHHAHTTSR